MQNLVCYVNAANTLGVVRDVYNAKDVAAPTMTRAVAACIKLRLFADESTEPYPLTALQQIAGWEWYMDVDFNGETTCILQAKHEDISVASVTETVDGTSRTFTEFSLPIPEMNTEELATLLGSAESISTLNGELVGSNADGDEVFVLQVKGFTVRNRIRSSADTTDLPVEYLTATQVRALLRLGLDLIFAETASDDPDDWHGTQLSTDTAVRLRLKGDTRNWTEGDAADYGWSDAFTLLRGSQGLPGADGTTYYCHAAFATASDGTGFITDGTNWTTAHKYLALLTTTKTAAQLVATDFAGLWMRFVVDDASGVNISDAGGYFTGTTVEAALQELGATLSGLDTLLGEI